MSSPYAPYASLQELLEAAGVPVSEMDRHSTQELLALAKKRAPKQPGRPVTVDRAPKVVRSIHIPFDLQEAVDRKARAAGTNFNQVVTKLLEGYVNGR